MANILDYAADITVTDKIDYWSGDFTERRKNSSDIASSKLELAGATANFQNFQENITFTLANGQTRHFFKMLIR